jgi:hypothetical protein
VSGLAKPCLATSASASSSLIVDSHAWPAALHESGHGQAHVRVVAQAPRRALRLGDEDELAAVDDGEPDELAGLLGEPVERRLRDVDESGRAEEAQASETSLIVST